MASSFQFNNFLMRLVFALALVLGTYNPTQYSYVSWLLQEGNSFGPVIAIVGLLLLIGWIIFLRATFMSMGWLGIVLGGALLACVVWLFVTWGILDLNTPGAMTWVGLILLAIILAVGMSWSHIRRHLTGQVDTDDLDNGRN